MAGRTAIGIVVDAGTVQAVELAADGQGLAVRRAACGRLGPEAFVDGALGDAGAAAECIRHLLRAHRMSRRNLCIALGGRLAIARVIEASAAGNEVEHILQERIARYAIYEDQEVLWKATALADEGQEKRSFLAAAVAKDEVAALLPALGRAGLHVAHVEPYALAAVRALATCPEAGEGPVILMTLRGEATDFVIAHGGRPLLVRSVDEGTCGLVEDPQRAGNLLVEARRSVEFCRTRFPGARPRLWVSRASCEGAEAARGLLARARQDVADADVEALPSWPASAGTGASDDARQAWAAVGAAMVGLGRVEAIPHLNLVPDEWPATERVQKQLVGTAASVGVAVVLTVLGSTMVRLTAGDVADEARAASVQMEANTVNVKAASKVKQQAAAAAARVKLWKDVRAEVRPADWAAALEAVTAQIPEGVRVREITYRRGVLRLEGEAQLPDLVHYVVERLGRLPHLEEAGIERLVRQPSSGGRLPQYVITCRLRSEAQPKEEPARAGRTAD